MSRFQKFINNKSEYTFEAKDLYAGLIEVSFYNKGTNFGFPITIKLSQLKDVIKKSSINFDKEYSITLDQINQLKKLG